MSNGNGEVYEVDRPDVDELVLSLLSLLVQGVGDELDGLAERRVRRNTATSPKTQKRR